MRPDCAQFLEAADCLEVDGCHYFAGSLLYVGEEDQTCVERSPEEFIGVCAFVGASSFVQSTGIYFREVAMGPSLLR